MAKSGIKQDKSAMNSDQSWQFSFFSNFRYWLIYWH